MIKDRPEYQTNYSQASPRLSKYHYSGQANYIMAKKMEVICGDFSRKKLSQCVCLDVACSAGYIAESLAGVFGRVYAFDIEKAAIAHARNTHSAKNVYFALGDATRIPFLDQTFDVVICNAVYEHVPAPEKLMSEIWRVLKPDGFCYFGAGNLTVMVWEPHYRLPLIAWLPRSWADRILRLTGRADYYYERFLNYRGLLGLTGDFTIHDFTLKVLKCPKKYWLDRKVMGTALFSRLPDQVLKKLYPFMPAYIWILTKKHLSHLGGQLK